MNAFVYNVQIKKGKWLTPKIVYLTTQIHAWAVMLTPSPLQLPSVISGAVRLCNIFWVCEKQEFQGKTFREKGIFLSLQKKFNILRNCNN